MPDTTQVKLKPQSKQRKITNEQAPNQEINENSENSADEKSDIPFKRRIWLDEHKD